MGAGFFYRGKNTEKNGLQYSTARRFCSIKNQSYLFVAFACSKAACPAARRAIGTLKGEQLT